MGNSHSIDSPSSNILPNPPTTHGSSGLLNQPYRNVNLPGSYLIPGQHPNRRSPTYSQQYVVTVPPNTKPGEKFRVIINNQEVMVTCPRGVKPNQRLTFTLPETTSRTPPKGYIYEITVPNNYVSGQPLVLCIGEQRIRVACPPNAQPGEKVRFQLPSHVQQKELESIHVDYDLNGWIRNLGRDLKFFWVYNTTGTSSASPNTPILRNQKSQISRTDIDSDAYVRQLLPASTELPDGDIRFVHASDYCIPSTVPNTSIDSYELASVASLSYPRKMDWLKGHFSSSIRKPWEEGHYKIRVRRSHLLRDSVDAILTIPPTDMNRIFRFEFLGEPGMDAGGLAREWFQLVSQEIFNPNFGLFLISNSNQMCLQINPHCHLVHPDYKQLYYFTGRFLGRALLDNQIIPLVHFIPSFYKHLMGFPLSLHDIESMDATVYRSFIEILEMENVEDLCLDFTVTESVYGEKIINNLKPNGEDITVTNENKFDYLRLQLQYRLFESIKIPLHEILKGFFEVISESLLAVLSPQELELFLHGLPQIDIQDWKQNTIYTGAFALNGTRLSSNGDQVHLHRVCQWFWEIVENYSQDYRAKLLQFSTGTSGVPSLGFSSLTGNDGNIRRFTLHGDPNLEIFPRSHTCFNRIDLPLYQSKEEMEKYLTLAITCESVGFGLV